MTITYSKLLKGYIVTIRNRFGSLRLLACDASRHIALLKALKRI